MPPLGEKATEVTCAFPCASKASATCRPLRRSHNRTDPSWWPDTTVLPPSLPTSTALHVELALSVFTALLVRQSNTIKVRSVEPVTSVFELLDKNFTACTLLEWPVREALSLSVFKSHTLIVRSVLWFGPCWPPPRNRQ